MENSSILVKTIHIIITIIFSRGPPAFWYINIFYHLQAKLNDQRPIKKPLNLLATNQKNLFFYIDWQKMCVCVLYSLKWTNKENGNVQKNQKTINNLSQFKLDLLKILSLLFFLLEILREFYVVVVLESMFYYYLFSLQTTCYTMGHTKAISYIHLLQNEFCFLFNCHLSHPTKRYIFK